MSLRRAPSLLNGLIGGGSPAAAGLQPLALHTGSRLSRFVTRVRGRHLLVLDIVGILLGGLALLILRSDRMIYPGSADALLPAIAILVTSRAVVNVRLGMYSRHWRFASVPDLERVVIAVALGSVAGIALFYGLALVPGVAWAESFPRSFWAAEFAVSLAVIGGSRFGIRVLAERAATPGRKATSERSATLLYGAGQSGVMVARSAQRGLASALNPVGFLDDDPSLGGRVVAGLRVFGGLQELPAAVEATGADSVLITMPSAPGKAVRRVVEAAMALGLQVRTVPSIDDLLDGTTAADRIRHVRVEDLLRRPIVSDHEPMVHDIIAGKTILITGAGGSIGSELARQAYAIGPARLILLDRSESALFDIHRELTTRQQRGHGSGEVVIHLANVASRASMHRLMRKVRPDVIFHAAAYKHVPMMESHPSDAAYVNVGGTMALLDAAMAVNVPRFVFVSTDKAVKPSSVMGASKRMGEMLVADAAHKTGRPYVSVRFGNVLGSNGSVVPIFRDQLERGEPLTITHPEMTRFFMTIPEAAWLILDASALGTSGDLFVLDMGDPVRVVDLARDLVRLAGRDPDSHPFESIGLRPGEKLHEELFYAHEVVHTTSSPKVLRVEATPPPRDIRERVRQILELATGDDEPTVARALLACANETADAPAVIPTATPARRARRTIDTARTTAHVAATIALTTR